jgi:hypothetical protein
LLSQTRRRGTESPSEEALCQAECFRRLRVAEGLAVGSKEFMGKLQHVFAFLGVAEHQPFAFQEIHRDALSMTFVVGVAVFTRAPHRDVGCWCVGFRFGSASARAPVVDVLQVEVTARCGGVGHASTALCSMSANIGIHRVHAEVATGDHHAKQVVSLFHGFFLRLGCLFGLTRSEEKQGRPVLYVGQAPRPRFASCSQHQKKTMKRKRDVLEEEYTEEETKQTWMN